MNEKEKKQEPNASRLVVFSSTFQLYTCFHFIRSLFERTNILAARTHSYTQKNVYQCSITHVSTTTETAAAAAAPVTPNERQLTFNVTMLSWST